MVFGFGGAATSCWPAASTGSSSGCACSQRGSTMPSATRPVTGKAWSQEIRLRRSVCSERGERRLIDSMRTSKVFLRNCCASRSWGTRHARPGEAASAGWRNSQVLRRSPGRTSASFVASVFVAVLSGCAETPKLAASAHAMAARRGQCRLPIPRTQGVMCRNLPIYRLPVRGASIVRSSCRSRW